ncbi:MAG: porphobilinogen synthase [Candidatus Symbiobacter sp.]|nr:porphobilinogen synthase [Candidatus Symbiobacter sp.]
MSLTAWPVQAPYPMMRHRRLRQAIWIRDLVAQSHLSPQNLIWPVFVVEGNRQEQPVVSLPGINRMSIDVLLKRAEEAHQLGINLIALFPVIDLALKTPDGREALRPDNLVCRAIQALKQNLPGLGVMADAALDPFTSHGHDGVLHEDGRILNDETVQILQQQALLQAQAGADVISPSDSMDGRIGAIRQILEEHGLTDKIILSYAVKYASGFFGPFRDAVGSSVSLGKAGKHTYQLDFRNSDEALREVAADLSEGADIVMVKPGMPYLDIVHRVKSAFGVPTFAYQVSGEYAMMKTAGLAGYLDYDMVMMESLMSFRRAGADAILTYAAVEIAKRLQKG